MPFDNLFRDDGSVGYRAADRSCWSLLLNEIRHSDTVSFAASV